MLRAILSVIAGYAVTFIMVFITFIVAFFMMGPDGAFRPGSYDPSAAWLIVSFILGLFSAIAGGWICAVIARSTAPPRVLIGLVLVLGLVMAIPVLMSSDGGAPPPRAADVGNFEAIQYAKTPGWVAIVNPIVGALGVAVGARLVRMVPDE